MTHLQTMYPDRKLYLQNICPTPNTVNNVVSDNETMSGMLCGVVHWRPIFVRNGEGQEKQL